MPQVLPIPDLRAALGATYSRSVLGRSKILRKGNIDAFFSIEREGLRYASLEHRISLYTTLRGEKIFIQLPGKESADSNQIPMPMDFRPKLQCVNGAIMQDASFGFIWDILENVGIQHREYLCFVATLFFHMGYMFDYSQLNDSYECVALQISGDNIEDVRQIEPVDLDWHGIDFSDDVWFSLNNYIGDITISDEQSISFEALVKFVDLLLQNEDCKYYYRNVIQGNNQGYDLKSGRTSTCDANLLILYYLQGKCGISYILDCFQKARGVPKFRKTNYHIVTDGIIIQG